MPTGNKHISQLPFFDLFVRLRNSGIMLKLEDFYDLLEAMDGGFGIDLENPAQQVQIDAFRRICCLLWVKTPADEALFDQQFDIYLEQEIKKVLAEDEEASLKQTHQTKDKAGEEGQTEEDEKGNEKAGPETAEPPKPSGPIDIPAPEVRGTEPKNPYRPKQHSFLFNEHYYPLKRREMQQSWRHLQRSEKTGWTTYLDVPATVKHFARKGYLEKPQYQAKYQNQIELSILVDVGGSMIAYDKLCSELVNTALQGGKVKQVKAYYFRNTPDDKLYLDPQRTEWIQVEEFYNDLQSLKSSVLIISDAGAARGSKSLKRLFKTEILIEEIRNKTLRLAWLNPFPPKRWKGSSAEQIASWLPMFTLNREGLDQAIDVLKGKV